MFDIILKECYKGVVTSFCYFVLMSSKRRKRQFSIFLRPLTTMKSYYTIRLYYYYIIYVSRGLINYNPTFLILTFHNGSW